MTFFSLTDDLLGAVCSEWLSVDELSVFDTACANHTLRAQSMQAVRQGKHAAELHHKDDVERNYDMYVTGTSDERLLAAKLKFLWRLGFSIRKLDFDGQTLDALLELLSKAGVE